MNDDPKYPPPPTIPPPIWHPDKREWEFAPGYFVPEDASRDWDTRGQEYIRQAAERKRRARSGH